MHRSWRREVVAAPFPFGADRDDSLKLVYPMSYWSLETDASSDHRILTLVTPDGFKVAFALKPADVGHLALSLVDSDSDVPFSVSVN